MDAPLFGDLTMVKREIDNRAMSRFFTMMPDVIKVGAEGYIHGWICVRPPCGKAGDKVTHGGHGDGVITGKDDRGSLTAKFNDGETGRLGTEWTAAGKPKAVKAEAANDANVKASELHVNGKKAVDASLLDHDGNVSLDVYDRNDHLPEGTKSTYHTKDGKVAGFSEAHNGGWDVYDANGKKLKLDAYSRPSSHAVTAIRLQNAVEERAYKEEQKRFMSTGTGAVFTRLSKDFKSRAKLTAKDKRAISVYTEGSQELNESLRATGDAALGKSTARDATALDSIASRYALPEAVTLYRGGVMTLPKHPVGSVIKDHGFTSTSLDPDAASAYMDVDYGDASGSQRSLFKINVPAGSHAIVSTSDDQQELILPRGSSFKITKATKNGDYTVYEMDMVQ